MYNGVKWVDGRSLRYDKEGTEIFITVDIGDCCDEGFIGFVTNITNSKEKYIYCEGECYIHPLYNTIDGKQYTLEGYVPLGVDREDFIVSVNDKLTVDMKLYIPESHEVMECIYLELLLGY